MYKLGLMERKFADIIWTREPISSKQLIKLAEEEFHWKSTTSYTVLKRLSDKGLFQNNNSIVTSLVSREDYYAADAGQYIEETFNGSLPAFITAFAARQKLTSEEAEELRKMVDRFLTELG